MDLECCASAKVNNDRLVFDEARKRSLSCGCNLLSELTVKQYRNDTYAEVHAHGLRGWLAAEAFQYPSLTIISRIQRDNRTDESHQVEEEGEHIDLECLVVGYARRMLQQNLSKSA